MDGLLSSGSLKVAWIGEEELIGNQRIQAYGC